MVALEYAPVGGVARGRTPLLLADDNGRFRETLAEELSGAGFEVAEAGDGREAVSVAARSQPRLVLLDVQMPVLSGLDAYAQIQQAIREGGREAAVPAAIFMTTGPTPAVRRDAERLGAIAVIDKMDVTLLRRLAKLLARSPWIAPPREGDARTPADAPGLGAEPRPSTVVRVTRVRVRTHRAPAGTSEHSAGLFEQLAEVLIHPSWLQHIFGLLASEQRRSQSSSDPSGTASPADRAGGGDEHNNSHDA